MAVLAGDYVQLPLAMDLVEGLEQGAQCLPRYMCTIAETRAAIGLLASWPGAPPDNKALLK